MNKHSTRAVVCPRCGMADTRVSKTKQLDDGRVIRRRKCQNCGQAIYTLQPPEAVIGSWMVSWHSDGTMKGLRDTPRNDGKIENIKNPREAGESGPYIDLANGSRICLKGSKDPDKLRGTAFSR